MRRVLVVLALLASTAAFGQGQPDLVVSIGGEAWVIPGEPTPIHVRYWNLSRTAAATGTSITFTSAAPLLTAPAGCTIAGDQATCSAATVPPMQGDRPDNTQQLTFTVRAPDRSSALFELTAAISSSEGDAVPHNNVFRNTWITSPAFFVTTTADSGPGSLRDAIEQVNGPCVGDVRPCVIGFRIPNGGAPWVTIATATPLPPILGAFTIIEGATQTEFAGDTNPHGPEVELTGVAQPDGNGLVYAACTSFHLRGLAINGFPGSGVLLAPRCRFADDRGIVPAAISGNYIGTDPTGTRAVWNQRGVSVDGTDNAQITGNVISGNLRSGVYVQKGRAIIIRDNKIGLTPALTPLGNGATGVYVSALGENSDVSHNFIGFNRHWGIAVDRDILAVNAAPNSLQGNFGLGIDWGHDMGPDSGRLGRPRITSVRVENGQTIIEGVNPLLGGRLQHEVHLYANDAPHWTGYGEGQYTLGSVRVSGATFTYTHPQDLRGKWVTATFTENVDGFTKRTSEFSLAVEVR
jgi:parallel beta-helix repeat protein